MKKAVFEEVELKVIRFGMNDIVTASGENLDVQESTEEDLPDGDIQ